MLAFQNSPFLKHTLRVISVLGVALMVYIIADPQAQGEYKEITCIGLIIFFTIMFLALTFPMKFVWVYRGFALLVFIVYLGYFVFSTFIGTELPIDSIASSKDSVNSLRGLIAYGIPGLLYFILGRTRSERGIQSNIE